jgi:hypothetical protein
MNGSYHSENGDTLMNKLVYKNKETGERFILRRVDCSQYILTNADGTEERLAHSQVIRRGLRFVKKESKPKRWANEKFFELGKV